MRDDLEKWLIWNMSWIRRGKDKRERRRRKGSREILFIPWTVVPTPAWLCLTFYPLEKVRWTLESECAALWPTEGWNRRSVNRCHCCLLLFVRVGHIKHQWPELQDGPNVMRCTSPPLSVEERETNKREGGGSRHYWDTSLKRSEQGNILWTSTKYKFNWKKTYQGF